MKVLLLLALLANSLGAITQEVIRVYQPLSFHFTDSATEFGPQGDLIQAKVVDRAMVLSGAFPEDLLKAVGLPCQLQSNNDNYKVPETNLVVLCGLRLEVSRIGKLVEVVIDCSEMKMPDFVELNYEQVMEMTVESLRRTLRLYYTKGEHEFFECQVTLSALPEAHKNLKKNETVFPVGINPDLPADLELPVK